MPQLCSSWPWFSTRTVWVPDLSPSSPPNSYSLTVTVAAALGTAAVGPSTTAADATMPLATWDWPSEECTQHEKA